MSFGERPDIIDTHTQKGVFMSVESLKRELNEVGHKLGKWQAYKT